MKFRCSTVQQLDKMQLLIFLAFLKFAASGSVVSVQLPYSNPAGVTYVEGKTSQDFVAGPATEVRNAQLKQSNDGSAQDFSLKSQVSSESIGSPDYGQGIQQQTFDRYIQSVNVPPTIQTIYESSSYSPFKQTSSSGFSSGNYVQSTDDSRSQNYIKSTMQGYPQNNLVNEQARSTVVQSQPSLAHYQSSSQLLNEKLISPQAPIHSFTINHSQPQSAVGYSTHTPSAQIVQSSPTRHLISSVQSGSEAVHPSSVSRSAQVVSSVNPSSAFTYSTPASSQYISSSSISHSSVSPSASARIISTNQPFLYGTSYSSSIPPTIIQPAPVPVAPPKFIPPTIIQPAPVPIGPPKFIPPTIIQPAPVPIAPPKPLVPVAYPAYAVPAAPAFPSIPVVKNIPAYYNVPFTQIQPIPGIIQKTLNVANPVLNTRTYEVRRPGVQRHFYDIEQRIIVRPAGSVVLELDQPISRIPKGGIFHPVGGSYITHARQEYGDAVHTGDASNSAFTGHYEQQIGVTADHALPDVHPVSSTTSAVSAPIISTTALPSTLADNDSVIIEAAKLKQANDAIYQTHNNDKYIGSNSSLGSTAFTQYLEGQQTAQLQQDSYLQQQNANHAYNIAQLSNYASPFMITVGEPDFSVPPYVETRSNGEPVDNSKKSSIPLGAYISENQSTIRGDIAPSSADLEQSVRNILLSNNYESNSDHSAEGQHGDNQQKYLRFVVKNQGMPEVANVNAGNLQEGIMRSQIIAASPASQGTVGGEQIHTRRIAISQPVETIQHVQEQVPFTKAHQVTVNQPATYKTASVDFKPVQTGVPILTNPIAPVGHPVSHPISVSYQNVQFDH